VERAALAGLMQLAAARRTADEARLADLRRRERELCERLAALDRPAGSAAPAGEDLLQRAAQDLKWRLWAEGRRRAIAADLSRLRAEIEDATELLRQSFGRAEAIGDLLARADRSRSRLRARRADRGEP
jgi:hypothetical protein